MHKNTWKGGERRIARMFKTERTPLSGGNSRHTSSDSLHPRLFVEVKHRKKYPLEKLVNKTLFEAKIENKIPLIVFLKSNSSEPLVLCRLKDIKEIEKELK